MVFFCLGSCLLDSKHVDDIHDKGASVPIDISNLFNSRAFAAGPNDANMDGIGGEDAPLNVLIEFQILTMKRRIPF